MADDRIQACSSDVPQIAIVGMSSSSSLIDLSLSMSSPSHPASSSGYDPCRSVTFRMVLQAREDRNFPPSKLQIVCG